MEVKTSWRKLNDKEYRIVYVNRNIFIYIESARFAEQYKLSWKGFVFFDGQEIFLPNNSEGFGKNINPNPEIW